MAAPFSIFDHLALGAGAGMAPLSVFHLTGTSIVPFANDLFSSDVSALAPGRGTLTCLLTAQGKLVSRVFIHHRGHEMLFLTPTDGAAGFRDAMAKYAGVSEHRFEQMTGWVAVFLTGAQADVRVNSLPKAFHVDYRLLGVDGYIGVVPIDEALALLPALLGKGFPDGVLAPETFEVFRVEGGVAKLGVDTPREVFPMEINLTELVSLEKECYVGQESVKRLSALGPPPRGLRSVKLSGAVPAGTPALVKGEEVGRLTSVVQSPSLRAPIGLALLRREMCQPGQALEFATRTGPATGQVVPFPNQPAE
ncbi:MAG TPA: glycine cleavage T C-terminal barrel domain-containing protein [Elusimicrobiota bacterium]|nr:glycine cleavage T C-terminal barrel domain-containing protein [Elusimicrobiota bacterium]